MRGRLIGAVLVAMILGLALTAITFGNSQDRPSRADDLLPDVVIQSGQLRFGVTVAFPAGGAPAVFGSSDCHTLALWDYVRGRQARHIKLAGEHELAGALAFSPNGQFLAAACSNTISLWNITSGELKTWVAAEGATAWVTSLLFAARGSELISTALDGHVKGWNVANVTTATTPQPAYDHDLQSPIRSAAIDADGTHLAISQFNKTLKLIDYPNWTVRWARSTEFGVVQAVAFQPTGSLLALGSDSDAAIHLWNTDNGMESLVRRGHSKGLQSLAFTSDGKTLVSSSADNTMMVWRAKDLNHPEVWKLPSMSFAVSPDNQIVAAVTGPSTAISIRDLQSGQEKRTLGGRVNFVSAVSFSPDGATLVIGDKDAKVHLWNLESGQPAQFARHNASVNAVAFRPDGQLIASADVDRTILLWSPDLQLLHVITNDRPITSLAFSPDGKSLVSADEPAVGGGGQSGAVKVWDIRDLTEEIGSARVIASVWGGYDSVSLSPDNRFFAASGHGRATLFELSTGRERWHEDLGLSGRIALSPDGARFATSSLKELVGWRLKDPAHEWNVSGRFDTLAYSADGKLLAASGGSSITIFDAQSGRELQTLNGHDDRITSMAFRRDNRILATGSWDATTRIWPVHTGKPANEQPTAALATIVSFTPTPLASSAIDWTVLGPEGYFDANNLESLQALAWVFRDDPFRGLAPETYLRQYYQPALLGRVLRGETFTAGRCLGTVNRVQPKIEFAKIEWQDRVRGIAKVTLRVARSVETFISPSGQSRTVETSVHDLRLFRDGHLVGRMPHGGTGSGTPWPADDCADSDPEKMKWRAATEILSEGTGWKVLDPFLVQVPRERNREHVTLSAYAFNEDRVKTGTVTTVVDVPAEVQPRVGTAYIISVGVNQTKSSPAWDLKYAANDARLLEKSLVTGLNAQIVNGKRTGSAPPFARVVSIKLVSDLPIASGGHQYPDESAASKAHLKTVLDLLAGRQPSTQERGEIPNADEIHRAQPVDLVLLAFSSHGYVGRDDGLLYLVLSNVDQPQEVTPALGQAALSSDELSDWLSAVDAGDLVMIVDACHSAAVQSEGFKPGPMGSSGLGQLAYDKGMRILAASRADQSAVERGDNINQGLLSYALAHEGLERGLAHGGRISLSQWLNYGKDRVPQLFKEGETSCARSGKGSVQVKGEPAGSRDGYRCGKPIPGRYQRPVLFDYSRSDHDIVLSDGR